MIGEKVILRLRMNTSNTHCYEEKVAPATLLKYFGDVNTELVIRYDGDEGLFIVYERVDFLAPVYIGDYIEYHGWIEKCGNTSRRLKLEAYKVIEGKKVLEEPVLVAKASGIIVVPKDNQRETQDPKFK
jgi:acyl-CoA hydrolase